MPKIELLPAATPADLPGEVRLQIVSSCAEPPARGGWLHEVSTTGTASWRSSPGTAEAGQPQRLRLHALFREPFRALAGLPAMVLDGEIAVPDARGVTRGGWRR